MHMFAFSNKLVVPVYIPMENVWVCQTPPIPVSLDWYLVLKYFLSFAIVLGDG